MPLRQFLLAALATLISVSKLLALESTLEVADASGNLPGRNDVFAAGGSVSLRAPAPDTTAVRWFRDGTLIAETVSGRMLLSGLSRVDTGNYQAVWTHEGRINLSALLPLTVGVLPQTSFGSGHHTVGAPQGDSRITLQRALNDGRVITQSSPATAGDLSRETRVTSPDLSESRILYAYAPGMPTLVSILEDGSFYLSEAPYRYREQGVTLPFILPTAFGSIPPAGYVSQGPGRMVIHNHSHIVGAALDGSVHFTTGATQLGLEFIGGVDALADGGIAIHGSLPAIGGPPAPGSSLRLNADGTVDSNFTRLSYHDAGNPFRQLTDGTWARLTRDRQERFSANGQNLPSRPLPLIGFSDGLTQAPSGAVYGHFEGLGIVRFQAGDLRMDPSFFLPQQLVTETRLPKVIERRDGSVVVIARSSTPGLSDAQILVASGTVTAGSIPIAGRELLVYGQSRSEFSSRLHPYSPESEFRPTEGASFTLYCPHFGAGTLEAGWVPLDGTAPAPIAERGYFYIPSFSANYAGRYQFVLSNEAGRTLGPVVDLRPKGRSRLSNFSGRSFVSAGDGTAIVGYVLRPQLDTGSPVTPRTTRLLIRGAGPALVEFGVPAPLPDPWLILNDAGSGPIASNDNWDQGTSINQQDFERVGAFSFIPNSRDAALVRELGIGTFTTHNLAKPGQSGVALTEVFVDEGNAEGSTRIELANLSLRGFSGAAEHALIGGFVVEDPDRLNRPLRLLIRAVGPTLSSFHVASPLADPVLRLFNVAREQIAINDNWSQSTDPGALAASAAAVGAFPLESSSLDSAMVVTLNPGAYTAMIQPTTAQNGIALLELYVLP